MHHFLSLFAIAMLAFSGIANANAPSCKSHRAYTAVDLSQPVTTITNKAGKTGVDLFKSLGVKTIARYYAWADDETTCKALFPSESDALIEAGFSIVTVFQHENSDPETFFDRSRGKRDANEALTMAGANGQPAGSAIYFAVDGVDQTIKDVVFEYSLHRGGPVSKGRKGRLLRADQSFQKHIKFYNRFRSYRQNVFGKPAAAITPRDMLPFVDRYFRDVNKRLKEDGRYRVGVYGSGMVCRHLLDQKLADFCWVAQSKGWPGTQDFLKSGRWSLDQEHTTFCRDWTFERREKVRFDFNRAKAGDIGQWSKKGKITPSSELPKKCSLGW